MKYRVLSPIKWDGERYEVGEEIELSEKAFQKLPPDTVEPASEAKEKAKAKK